MAKKKPKDDREQANYRLGRETLDRIEQLREALARRLGLVDVSRSDVVRMAVKEMHERECGK